ncbi:hypothetical protein A2707_05640 [Candidatus Saccharibacteria bacterium RIFCSPHIGHO2_01_FULL_45_15]|nr:MAG: hypothetical protein A2707_05640 [Candidatus Saccharibacteria bacterium RIFCSPHIGHO2_01_FULL_45_15]OGL28929.1 MAG: hypothetical protein A3C39_05855 [Candidatus Saccharibacteria bacterium RIFCSPHIGHO2_02_FULL_46_12]OGL31942.1 MAG: hypothetical protein A3E76_01585 [Candidatus Saccharibacteria bacterium RIFCSPHIGHO2_12_FULL_44_22]
MDKLQYPVLRDNPSVAHMDASATFPIHEAVIQAVQHAMTAYVGAAAKASYDWSFDATSDVANARAAIAALIGATADQIFFTTSASDSARLTYDVIGKRYKDFIYSPEDHTSTIRLFADTRHVTPLTYGYDGTYDLSSIAAKKGQVPMMFVSLVHHLYGSDNDLTSLRHKWPNAFIVVDASQAIGRMAVDVTSLECDALYFSSQKIGGIAGAGVLYVRDIRSEYRNLIEPNTVPIPAIVSMGAAAKIIMKQGIHAIDLQLMRQSSLLVQQMNDRVARVTFSKGMAHSDYRCRNVGIVSFKIEGYGSQDIAMILNDHHINVRAGDHCVDGDVVDRDVVRVSMHAYTTDDDINRLVDVLAEL